MKPDKWLKMARIIRYHYQLSRPVTRQEVDAEVANLRRRLEPDSQGIALGLDDMDGLLYARLEPYL